MTPTTRCWAYLSQVDTPHVPIIETELEFVEVGRKMLGADLMVRTHDRPLDERERALYGVRVNGATHVLAFRVGDSVALSLLVFDAVVGLVVVGVALVGVRRVLFDEAVERLGPSAPSSTASATAAPSSGSSTNTKSRPTPAAASTPTPIAPAIPSTSSGSSAKSSESA
jgi:hypothetical protein